MRVQRAENGRDIELAFCDDHYAFQSRIAYSVRVHAFPWDHVQPSDRVKRVASLVCATCGLTEKKEQALKKV